VRLKGYSRLESLESLIQKNKKGEKIKNQNNKIIAYLTSNLHALVIVGDFNRRLLCNS